MEYKGEVYSVKKSCLKEKMATYENVDPFDSIMNALLSNVKELNLFFRAIHSNIVIKEGKHSSIRKIDFLPKYNQEEPEVVLKDDELEIYYVIKHKKRNDINVPFMMLEFTTELIRLSVEEKEKEQKEYKIPIVIPIVIYTGVEKWEVPLELRKLQVLKSIFPKDLMNQKYILIDINDYYLKPMLGESKILEAIFYDRLGKQDKLIKLMEE